MSIKSVLVTGGAGYVGGVLVPKLLGKGYKVKVVDWYIFGRDVLKKCRSNSNLREIKGDIRNKNIIKKALKDVDAVIHLACISNDPSFELDPKLGRSVNYDATIQLIDLAKDLGVRRFIYASSSSVYGIKKEKEVTEELSLEPLTDYSKYKVLCEEYLLDRNSPDFNVLVLRPSTVCGYSSRLRLDLTVNLLTIAALVNKRMTVFGGGQMRPNIHIEDMADLYVKTLQYEDNKIAGKVYNAGYDNFTVLEIARKVKKVLADRAIKIEITPSNDQRSYRVSSKKIKKELGFGAKRSVEEAIGDIAQAYKRGLIPNPMSDRHYYNIKTMQALNIK